MSIYLEIQRLQNARDKIRTKLSALGLVTVRENIDACAAAVESMKDNGAVSATLDTTATSYTIPKGYHSGAGEVKILPETKAVTPTRAIQKIKPTAGRVLTDVNVAAIPVEYIDTTSGDAVSDDIMNGKKAYVNGELLTGTMANNGDVGGYIDGLTVTSRTVPAGYTSGGTVVLTGDIEAALAEI